MKPDDFLTQFIAYTTVIAIIAMFIIGLYLESALLMIGAALALAVLMAG